MPFIRSFAFKRCTKLISTIISFGEIMPSCSRYIERKLLYIIIIAPFSRQPSSCTKCTWANMRSFYDVRLIFNTKCTFPTRYYSLQSLRLPYLIYRRVLRISYY